MALIDESLVSDPRKQKWVDEISKILTHQPTNPFKLIPKPSIFQVPEKLAAEKPEAYEPQYIGLGPNHHFRPQLYKRMEQKKLAVVQSVLQDRQINDFNVVIDNIRKIVPRVRACYDMFLQDDDDTLAWVFAIDGIFLLELISSKVPLEKNQWQTFENEVNGIVNIIIANDDDNDMLTYWDIGDSEHFHFPSIPDILMMENQIPFVVLEEICKALLQASSGPSTDLHNIFSPSKFRAFISTHSPLWLCRKSAAPTKAEHLLDYMYQSIIRAAPSTPPDELDLVGFSGWAPPPDFFSKLLDFINQIPKENIVQIYKRIITALETFSQSKTPMPSASEYHKRAGIRFDCLDFHEGGIRNICIDGEKFVLPFLMMKTGLEVVLRNLVAYELFGAKSDKFPFTEYVSVMCGLIKSTSDVKILRENGIIQKYDLLDDEEVVKLFTGMSSFILISMEKKKNKESELTKMIEEANKVYERKLSTKAIFLMKKLASWLLLILKAIGGFVERSWKIVSIGTVILLTLQAFCNTYGCEKTNVTLLSYVSR